MRQRTALREYSWISSRWYWFERKRHPSLTCFADLTSYSANGHWRGIGFWEYQGRSLGPCFLGSWRIVQFRQWIQPIWAISHFTMLVRLLSQWLWASMALNGSGCVRRRGRSCFVMSFGLVRDYSRSALSLTYSLHSPFVSRQTQGRF